MTLAVEWDVKPQINQQICLTSVQFVHDNIAFYYKLSHKIERIIYPNFIFENVIFSRLKNRKKVIFFKFEIITFYITSALSIYLLLITSECQAPIIF